VTSVLVNIGADEISDLGLRMPEIQIDVLLRGGPASKQSQRAKTPLVYFR